MPLVCCREGLEGYSLSLLVPRRIVPPSLFLVGLSTMSKLPSVFAAADRSLPSKGLLSGSKCSFQAASSHILSGDERKN